MVNFMLCIFTTVKTNLKRECFIVLVTASFTGVLFIQSEVEVAE